MQLHPVWGRGESIKNKKFWKVCPGCWEVLEVDQFTKLDKSNKIEGQKFKTLCKRCSSTNG